MANATTATTATTAAPESAVACVVRVRAIVSAEHARAGFGWCGVVESVRIPAGNPTQGAAWIGHRVTSLPEVACGSCDRCRSGLGAHCEHGTEVVISAERAMVMVSALARVPEGLDDGLVASAWMVARAVHASRAAAMHARGFVTVLGEDALGLALAQVLGARWASTRVLADGEFASRACERLAIKHRKTDDAGRRSDQDAVFLCAPTPATLHLACELARPRGIIVVASEPTAPGEPWKDALLLAAGKEVTLIHAVRPAHGTLGEAIAILERGVVQPQLTQSSARAIVDMPPWTIARLS